MSSAGDPRSQRFALRAGVQLYPMADGSGVLAEGEPGEALALNAEATRLLSPAGHWSEASLAAELRSGGASADLAAAHGSQFLDGLQTLGVLAAFDD